jgi:hypothetical protein
VYVKWVVILTLLVVVSGTTINGVTGLWAIDGQIIETSAEE